MPRVPISPTIPTTATSTSSNAPFFPFHGASSPSPSSQTSLTRAQRTAEARTAFTASLRSAGAHLDGELKARGTDLHHNAQVIEQQDRDFRERARTLREENEKLEDLVREQKQSLFELGIQTRSQLRRERELGFPDGQANTAATQDGTEGATTGFDGIAIHNVPGLGTVGDVDDFLMGVEQDLLVLEETCRIVEDGEEYTDEDEPSLDQRELQQETEDHIIETQTSKASGHGVEDESNAMCPPPLERCSSEDHTNTGFDRTIKPKTSTPVPETSDHHIESMENPSISVRYPVQHPLVDEPPAQDPSLDQVPLPISEHLSDPLQIPLPPSPPSIWEG